MTDDTGWRKSSRSANNGACVQWRTSSHSSYNGNCVQVAPGVQVRDSKDADGTVLSFGTPVWRAFTDGLKAEGVAH